MAIRDYNLKFVFTAENDDHPHHDDDEIIVVINAYLIPPDTAGEHVDIGVIIDAFERIGFPRPIFKYGKISSTKEISFSEFVKEWELADPFGLQLIHNKDCGYSFNLYTPRDVIPKKR